MRFLLLCLLAVATPLAAGPIETDTDSRVVAFGDVHGAIDEFTVLLREVGVTDADNNWSGGNTHLVSLGDLVDRGPGSREVVELLMKLESQAGAAGGAVHVVLGNHEVMVMTGDLRYVSRPEFAAFASDETAEEREALFQGWLAEQPAMEEAAARASFDDKFPPGFIGLQKAYAPDGALGSWLKTLPLVIRVNDRLYMHAGASSKIEIGRAHV